MKNKKSENYLDKKPAHAEFLNWTQDDAGMVTLSYENKGVFNRIAQKLLKKPKISYVHLDETVSFVWPLIDGEKTIADIGKELEAKFGEKANPVYQRLAKFFQILDSYGFVKFK